MLFPIEKLLEGRGAPVCVGPESTIGDALTLMVEHDFTQLPIVDRTGALSGIITEALINRMYYHVGGSLPLLDLQVDHCQTKPATISPDSDVFEALDLLKSVYAVVVVEDDRPVGILTDYDTTHFFRDLSEGLILVEDIEVSLRQTIESAFPDEEALKNALIGAFGSYKSDPARPKKEYGRLGFWEHMRLITAEDNWPMFRPVFASEEVFYQLMDQVRQIRNQMAHFRGRPDAVQHDALLRARDWLEARPKPAVAREEGQETVRVAPEEVPREKPASKYAPLSDWLTKQGDRGSSIRVSFQDLESLLGTDLPPSARQHRSWWSNDQESHSQSLSWMRAGWRVDDVDLQGGEVVFRQDRQVLYQLFFADMLKRLKTSRPGATRATKAYAQNWWSFGAGKSGFSFMWAFARDETLNVQVYIDTGSREENKAAYDGLYGQRAEIEAQVGQTLIWERLEDKRACRISASRPAMITDLPEEMEQAKQWALETMLRFVDVFRPRIREL